MAYMAETNFKGNTPFTKLIENTKRRGLQQEDTGKSREVPKDL